MGVLKVYDGADWVTASGPDEKVKIDVAATADYLGAASGDGVLRTSTGLAYADGGNFITLAVDVGIADDKIMQVDDADAADDDYAKFTAAGLEGRDYSEVLSDLSGQASAAFDLNGQDLTNGGVLFLTEQANAEVDVPGKGQLWVKTGAPNTLYFTNEDGTDLQLGVGGTDYGTSFSWNMCTDEPDVIGQGTWDRTQTAAYFYHGHFSNTASNDDGDNFTLNFYCAAGTYKLTFHFVKATNRGIIDVYIDASEEGSFDGYAGATDHDNVEIISGISISAGAHTLKFQIDGKHASSTDHVNTFQHIHLIRVS